MLLLCLPAALAACTSFDDSHAATKAQSGEEFTQRDWEAEPFDPDALLANSSEYPWGKDVAALRRFFSSVLWPAGHASLKDYYEKKDSASSCSPIKVPATRGGDFRNMPLFFPVAELKGVPDMVKQALSFTPDGLYACMRLDGFDLTGANLTGAGNPKGCAVPTEGANLRGTNFNNAHLPGFRLGGATVGPRIEVVDLALLREQVVAHMSFAGANLQGADLQGANLQGADLQGANLQGAHLKRAYLREANLQGANLREANLREAYLDGANLQGADLQGANLYNADLPLADLQGANLQGADLYGANLRNANLRNANLERADLREADLRGADLQGANFRNANVERAKR